ncbi:MAG TPA: hypothetical protein VEC99_08545, partial [Clostridia bacterium]|nr:hypothetical protein [Clostridia bacterium]
MKNVVKYVFPGRILAWVLLFFICSGTVVQAQTNTNATATVGQANRFLLVVETSKTMQRRSQGVIQVVRELLDSGMGGQLRKGDSLGIWTFNEKLYTGQLPLQQWSAEAKSEISSRVIGFLEAQKFGKAAKLENVVPALGGLAEKSEFLTIILISSGVEGIHGTPLDHRINDSFAWWREQQQTARMPFVTLMRAQAGKFTECAVAAAPWPLEWPPLPKELLVARPVTQPPPATQPKPAARPAPKPLILSGKKSEAPAVANSAETTILPKPEPTLPSITVGSEQAPSPVAGEKGQAQATVPAEAKPLTVSSSATVGKADSE